MGNSGTPLLFRVVVANRIGNFVLFYLKLKLKLKLKLTGGRRKFKLKSEVEVEVLGARLASSVTSP